MTGVALQTEPVPRPTTTGAAHAADRLLGRNFLLLLQAHVVSQLGSQTFMVATIIWTTQATGSAAMSGLMMAANTLPLVLLGQVAGTLADWRRSWLRIVIACDLMGGVLAGLLALGFKVGPEEWRAAMLLATVLLLGVCAAFFEPAVNALIPELVPRDAIERAYALRSSAKQLTSIGASGLGGILYPFGGPLTLFLANGLSFFLAACSEMGIRPGAHDLSGSAQVTSNPNRSTSSALSFREQVLEGLGYVTRQPGMMVVLTSCAVLNALLMPVSILLPVYATTYLDVDVRWYGFLLAAVGVGTIVGSASVGAVGGTLVGSARRLTLVSAFAGMALGMVALGQIQSPLAALALLFGMGVLTGTINVLTISIVQRTTPREFRGRVMGTFTTITRALVPVALLGGGALADATGRNVPLVYSVCGVVTLATPIMLMSRHVRFYLASA